MPIDETIDDSRQNEELIQGDIGDTWSLVFERMANCLTLMTRERMVVETIGIVTANPDAIQARWKALQGRIMKSGRCCFS